MILLLTNQRDVTTDFIVLELQRRGLPYFRLNTESISSAKANFSIYEIDDWSLELDGSLLNGQKIQSAFFRRPGIPSTPAGLEDDSVRAYCQTEWGALLKNLYSRLDGRWLNAPTAIVLAEDKPKQLMLANRLGFNIPETKITNDIDVALALSEDYGVIGKPLREALLEGAQERVIFTSRLKGMSLSDGEALALSPIIIQREIPKRFDIRVTVVGETVFATEIHSQVRVETEVDWRCGSLPDIDHKSHALPREESDMCVLLVQALGLRFGAIDLVFGADGNYWFLEINPNGQWAWIENRTGVPIAEAIVNELLKIKRV